MDSSKDNPYRGDSFIGNSEVMYDGFEELRRKTRQTSIEIQRKNVLTLQPEKNHKLGLGIKNVKL